MKELITSLTSMANGRHPASGKPLPDDSVAHRPEAIRLLFALAQELTDCEPPPAPTEPTNKPRRKTAKERRQENISKNRPARTNFVWTARELTRMLDLYHETGNMSEIARKIERSELAIAMKLYEVGVFSLEQVDAYSNPRAGTHKRWTEDELTHLMDSYSLARDVSQVAALLNRTELATAIKLCEVGILTIEEVQQYR